jgi:hypothetical protein
MYLEGVPIKTLYFIHLQKESNFNPFQICSLECRSIKHYSQGYERERQTSLGRRKYTSVPGIVKKINRMLELEKKNLPQPSMEINSRDPPKYLVNH